MGADRSTLSLLSLTGAHRLAKLFKAAVQYSEPPREMWESIFLKLPRSSLVSAQSVCKAWDSIIRSPDFRASYHRLYPIEPHVVVLAVVLGEHNRQQQLLGFNLSQNSWVDVVLRTEPWPVITRDGLLCYQETGVLWVYNLVTGIRTRVSLSDFSHHMIVSHLAPPKLLGYEETRLEPFTYDLRTKALLMHGHALDPSNCCVVASNSSKMNVIYADVFDPLHLYDFDRDAWTVLDLPCYVGFMSFFECGSRGLVVVGSVDDLIGVWKLERAPDSWTLLTECPFEPPPRFKSACTDGLDDIWMLLGSKDDRSLANYNMASNEWTQLPPPTRRFKMTSELYFTRF